MYNPKGLLRRVTTQSLRVAGILSPGSGSHQALTHSSYFNALKKSTELSETPSVYMEVLAGLGPWGLAHQGLSWTSVCKLQ